jgi:Pyridoxamine 5'-phosphate oxidase
LPALKSNLNSPASVFNRRFIADEQERWYGAGGEEVAPSSLHRPTAQAMRFNKPLDEKICANIKAVLDEVRQTGALPRSAGMSFAAERLQRALAIDKGRTRMPGFVIANFRHVADGLQEGQFAVGEHKRAATLDDLDPIYRQLLDQPITQALGLIGFDGRISLTPMWFDYENDKILVNTASHRPKCEWIRRNPQMTSLLVNPENPYHWVQIKHTVEKELRE